MITAHPTGGAMITLGTGGHQPALLLRADTGAAGEQRPVPGGVREYRSPAVNCWARWQNPTSSPPRCTYNPATQLLLYTDGLTDPRPNGEPFGEDGLVQYLADRTTKTAGDLVTDLATLINGFDAAPTHDVALLALTAQRT